MIRPSRQIWLCLHLPALALEVFVDGGDGSPDQPHQHARAIAIIEQQRVLNCNAAASSLGVEIAMTLNTAHALCPDLQVLERQPLREQEALQQLAHWIYRLSPELALAADNSLLIEIGSCRRLYGGLTPLLDVLQNGLVERGYSVVMGLAHTRKAAWLLAQHRQPLALSQLVLSGTQCDASEQGLDAELLRRQIGALPIYLMAVDRAVISGLEKMGITSVAKLTALPLAALGKRFGVEFIRYLQQVLGTHPDPQPVFVPAPTFCAGLSFIDGIHNRQALLFPIKRLLQTLCDYLDSRQLLCTTLHWEFHAAQLPQATMTIELMRAKSARSQRYLRDLLELSELKLQNLVLRDAVYALVLRSDNFLPAQPASLQLFSEDDEDDRSLAPLLDKLRARLGSDALHQIHYRDVHWPENASLQRSIDGHETIDSADRMDCTSGNAAFDIDLRNSAAQPSRPLWLFPRPQALREHDKKLFWPTSMQLSLSHSSSSQLSSLQLSALQLLRGPERIDGHWWEQSTNQNTTQGTTHSSDQKAQARDYYVASAGDGRLCWIFRDLGSGRWFLHGLFA